MEFYRRSCIISVTCRKAFKNVLFVRYCCKQKQLTLETMNQNLVTLQYAVRGPVVARSIEIEEEIKKGKSKKPYKKVIRVNLGDAHAMGQKPVTFVRQVLSCVSDTSLLQDCSYPYDVRERAKTILGHVNGSVGSYTHSNGVPFIRKNIADFISQRDGFPCDWNQVVLGAGASAAIKCILTLFSNNPCGMPSGIMIPIPQYPLYTAAIAEYGLFPVEYYLDEDNKWGLDLKELERALKAGSEKSQVRAIVVINPGNPTGQVLTKENIETIFKFAHKHNLFIFADEVYQDNIHDQNSKFWSFQKVKKMMGEPYKRMELASFMSISKGFLGECGLRGGWMVMSNLDPQVEMHLNKKMSADLCCSVLGQVACDCYARQPKCGDPSYELFVKEKSRILFELKERAELVYHTFNKMDGFKCNVVQGAMYAFPRIDLPVKAIGAAKKARMAPDAYYALRLLEDTGICIVPGSGFGQKPGTYHFRTTILAQTPVLKEMFESFKKFHQNFTKEFA